MVLFIDANTVNYCISKNGKIRTKCIKVSLLLDFSGSRLQALVIGETRVVEIDDHVRSCGKLHESYGITVTIEPVNRVFILMKLKIVIAFRCTFFLTQCGIIRDFECCNKLFCASIKYLYSVSGKNWTSRGIVSAPRSTSVYYENPLPLAYFVH